MLVTVGEADGSCAFEAKLLGPVHDHAVALLELDERVALDPEHMGLSLVAPVDDGIGLTVTAVVYTVDCEQPVVELLMLREYVPDTVGVAVGFCTVEVKPLGPDQDHVFALVELAANVTVPVTHIGLLLVAPVEVGVGFTVTIVVYFLAQPEPLFTVTV